ncbi:TonB-dependent receptor plug domain-containing protein [Pleionea sediminis]|uniref:TonB-dependent receptor plug domain-containing protein n=1 Tax=Pleionea sediminis TaxID=2569479 RepID=UPI001185C039|nr:TonB-dependent receptor plug domain-containing protein [Pleionea sediminis]
MQLKKVSVILLIALTHTSHTLSFEDSLELEDGVFDQSLPIVLSATRLKQPKSETPAAVTVIDHETISQMGFRTLAEIFRLVPGMYVGYERGHQPEIGYHTLAGENSRHLQVLIDGRSIYQPALARILWKDIPIDLQKISRIEIIRGPNTALYGANSYLAVINIITFHPEDRLGGLASITHGNHGINDGQVNYTQNSGNFSFDVTAGYHSDDGFEIDRNDEKRFDKYDTQLLNADFKWQQSNNDYFRFEFGIAESEKQVDDLDDSEITDFHPLDLTNGFAQFSFAKSTSLKTEFKTQAFISRTNIEENWISCLPALFLSTELYDLYDLDPAYTVSVISNLPAPPTPTGDPEIDAQTQLVIQRLLNGGAETVCGTANQDMKEHRFDFETQMTTQLESSRIVAGLSYRNDKAKSESYFSGTTSKDIWRLFSNWELSPAESWRINLGGMYEKDNLVGSTLTPRAAVNWLYEANQSLRIIYSKANRSPDLFEFDNDRSYLLRNLVDTTGAPTTVNSTDSFALFYQHSQSTSDLDFEEIQAWELGWYFRNASQTIEFDVRLFKEELENLLEGSTSIALFSLENSGEVDVTGIEAQFEWTPNASTKFMGTYSNVDHTNLTDLFYRKSGAERTYSLHSIFEFENSFTVAGSYYRYKNWFRTDFERFDASINYSFNLGDYKLDTRLSYQHRFDEDYLLDLRNRYTNPDKIYATISLNW